MHLFDRIGDEYEQVIVCHDAATGPAGGGGHPLHRARAGPRGHPLLPLPVGGGRLRGRPPVGPRHDLQVGGRRPRPRRRQGGDHRQPGAAQDRGPAAHLRAVRRLPRRPLHHRRGRGHHPGRHGPHPAGDPQRDGGFPLARGVRRSVGRDRLRPVVGDEGGHGGARRRHRPGGAARGRERRGQGRHRPGPPSGREPGPGVGHRHRRRRGGAGDEGLRRDGRRGRGRPHRGVRHLLALRPRRRPLRAHHQGAGAAGRSSAPPTTSWPPTATPPGSPIGRSSTSPTSS